MVKVSKENIFIALGALALSLALILPQRISTCPKGQTLETAIPGGGCPLFVDENQDGICDLVQGIATPKRSNFDFSYAPEFFTFLSLFIIAIVLSLVNFPKRSNLPRGWTFRKPYLRYLTLAAGLLLGIWSWKKLCPLGTLQLLFLEKDKIVLLFFPFLVLLIPIIATLVFGRIFCLWICPIGPVQEFIWKISRWLGKRFGLRIPDSTTKIPPYINNVNYLLFAVLAAGIVYFGESVFCKICPFGLIFGCSKTTTIFIFLLLTFAICLLTFLLRPFCRFFCPYGAILKFLSKFSLRRPVKKEKK